MLVLACLFVSVSVSVLVLVFVFVFVFVFALAFVFVSGCLLCHACTLAQNAHSLDTLLPPFFFLAFSLVQMLKKHKVKHLVRVCEPSYNVEDIEKQGIEVHVRFSPSTNLPLPITSRVRVKEGGGQTVFVVEGKTQAETDTETKFARLCVHTHTHTLSLSLSCCSVAGFLRQDWPCEDGAPPPKDVRQKWLKLCKETFDASAVDSIAVHCVAGLGRAPVLVAISLIEGGMTPEDAVLFIRKHRHGAINKRCVVQMLGAVLSARCMCRCCCCCCCCSCSCSCCCCSC